MCDSDRNSNRNGLRAAGSPRTDLAGGSRPVDEKVMDEVAGGLLWVSPRAGVWGDCPPQLAYTCLQDGLGLTPNRPLGKFPDGAPSARTWLLSKVAKRGPKSAERDQLRPSSRHVGSGSEPPLPVAGLCCGARLPRAWGRQREPSRISCFDGDHGHNSSTNRPLFRVWLTGGPSVSFHCPASQGPSSGQVCVPMPRRPGTHTPGGH